MHFLALQDSAWDSAFWEFSLVFEDLANEDLWTRPHPRLLSVGEITALVIHALVRYVQMYRPETEFDSPLALHEARYYLHTVESDPLHPPLGVTEVAAELDRVQREAKLALRQVSAELDTPLSEGPGETFGQFADYMVFHAAYHTGQAFSVRHLMGHVTNDN
ncbi:MAG TPA: DinB family protein [Fimbriimonadaceae bacterium]|nr:DinB family protein [Fimbriimonadaceae bacterium]HRJ33932.1 DinB family protein [Fimbriimonadaceae bacterium]